MATVEIQIRELTRPIKDDQRSQSVLSAVHQTDELSLWTLPSSTYILVNGFDGEKNWTSASQICALVGDILVINWSRWLAQSSTKALAKFRGSWYRFGMILRHRKRNGRFEVCSLPFLLYTEWTTTRSSQFDHQYPPKRPQIRDTADTENNKKIGQLSVRVSFWLI